MEKDLKGYLTDCKILRANWFQLLLPTKKEELDMIFFPLLPSISFTDNVIQHAHQGICHLSLSGMVANLLL